MPQYIYTAANIKGKKTRGQMAAANRTELAARLKSQQQYLLDFKEATSKTENKKLNSQKLSEFNRQIGTMLSSGISLVRAIEIILRRDISKNERVVYEKIQSTLLSGFTLSDAMEQMGNVFPILLINMYRAAEANGTLDLTALKMADHYEKEHRLKTKIRSATAYPILLLCMVIIVMILIFNFVLPRFANVYGEMELPQITKIVMSVSNLFTDHFLILAIVILLVVLITNVLYKVPQIRVKIDRLKLRSPLIGKLLRIIYTARFARTLSSLYSSGLSILNALEIARGTIGNAYIESQFDTLIGSVRNGYKLSESLESIDGYDRKLASTVLIGEETGRLDYMLNTVADSFDYEAEQATNRLIAILEPLLIIIMAAVVGTVMISVLLPIYGLYSSIASYN